MRIKTFFFLLIVSPFHCPQTGEMATSILNSVIVRFPPVKYSSLPQLSSQTSILKPRAKNIIFGEVKLKNLSFLDGLVPLANGTPVESIEEKSGSLIGEDSAKFELGEQKIKSWIYFGGILGSVLLALDYFWIEPGTGYGKAFIDAVSSVSDSKEVTMLLVIFIFGVAHSGLASLRDSGEKVVGERAFRVLFAGISLPLALSTIVYFINHRYDGTQLWQLQSVFGLHELVWVSNFISFLFLYPSTFNLLEVAAVDKPKMHLWETGIMRISRHPQLVGQVLWCLAHTLWIGNSVAVAASVGLIGHHVFGAWNGDRRLRLRYGQAFDDVKRRTSVFPFAAIVDGRQKLPRDYYKEFIRLPYLLITALTLAAYFAHPFMRSSSFSLHW